MISNSFINDLYTLLLREMSGDKTAYEAIQKSFQFRPAQELSEFVENIRNLESAAEAVFRELVISHGHNAGHVWNHEIYPELGRPWEIHEDGKFLTRHCTESERIGGFEASFVPVEINSKFPRTDCGGTTIIYWIDNACESKSHCCRASVLSTDMEIK